jgi:molecular chaperone DnaK (HSP70)
LKYIIGIDLGTTNSVLAYCELGEDVVDGSPQIQLLKVPQLVAQNPVEARP